MRPCQISCMGAKAAPQEEAGACLGAEWALGKSRLVHTGLGPEKLV